VRTVENDTATLEIAVNFREGHHSAWGVFAKNREQNFAFNVLMDPEIDFVTLLGTAGTGKSYQRAFKFIISTSCFYPGLHFIAMRFPEVIRQGSRTTI
jgi:hypothetical protein